MEIIRLATKGCPATGCESKDKQKIIYWNHICSNNAYLDRYANVLCFYCHNKYPILQSRFKCQNCHNFSFPNFTRLGRILAALSTMEFDNVRTEVSNFSQQEFSSFLDDVCDNLNLSLIKDTKKV